MLKTPSIAAAIALAALLAAFTAPTVSAAQANSISILIHPCNFAQHQTGTWETAGAVTDSGTYVRTGARAFPPNLPFGTPGVRIIEKFLLTSGSGSLAVTVRQVTGVPNGRWHTTEGTGAYEHTEWHGTGVAFYQTPTPNSCPTPQNHFTFALTGVTGDDGEVTSDDRE
jgi:hypothetical protein